MKALNNTIDGAALLKHDKGRTKDISRNRIRHPLLCQPQLNSMGRAYLRDLRAAEMIAWQLSGGDYLISRCETVEIMKSARLNHSTSTPAHWGSVRSHTMAVGRGA